MEPSSLNPIDRKKEYHPIQDKKIQDKKTRSHEEKPDQVYKKTDPVQESPNKDIRATQESKNPKIERVASQKILQQYKESQDEPDIDEAGIEEISQALDRFILPLNKNSIFSDTDLVLIDNAFSGNMPLNGIKKSELKHIEQLFKSICEGKEKLKISADNAPFKTQTEEAIKLLLTRNIGRKLIQKILENPLLTKVEILRGETSEVIFKNALAGVITITMKTHSDSNQLYYHPTGKIMLRDNPFYITLAHEMVHVSHYPNPLTLTSPTFTLKYHTMEEQLTITGLKKDLSLETPEYDFKENYDELNEWNITAAFTNSQNVFFPRFSHIGMTKNFFPLNADNIERIKSAQKSEGIERKNLLNDIEKIVELGVLYDLEELYKLNIVDISKLFENHSPPLIHSALFSGDVKMVQFLMNKGFDINQNAADSFFKDTGVSMLKERSEMIKFLVENKLSTHAAYENIDFTLIDQSNMEEVKDLVNLILKDYIKFSNINQKNADIFFDNFKPGYFQTFPEIIKIFIEHKLSTHAAFNRLDFEYMDPSTGEEHKALLKLIFKDYLKSPDYVLPLNLLSDRKPGSNQEKSIEIFMDCVSENIQEFLTEIHTPDEYTKKGKDIDNIAFLLEMNGFDTTHLKDSLSELYRKEKDL